MAFSDFFGQGMTPTARIVSGIISLIILAGIFIVQYVPQFPQNYVIFGYGWLAFHIANQLYVAISEKK
jgi:hypothetical protein